MLIRGQGAAAIHLEDQLHGGKKVSHSNQTISTKSEFQSSVDT